MRPDTDDLPTDWWFCSTAIPLLAATIGPLANVLSIAALVTPWRQNYNPQFPDVDDQAVGFRDPKWCLGLNGASLACGFVGNFFLLLNFTRRVRYIVALPVTIVLWYIATGIVSLVCSFFVLLSFRTGFACASLGYSLYKQLQGRSFDQSLSSSKYMGFATRIPMCMRHPWELAPSSQYHVALFALDGISILFCIVCACHYLIMASYVSVITSFYS